MPGRREALAQWVNRYQQWRDAKKLARRAAKPAEADVDGIDWDTRGKRALAMKREHELEVQQGKFLPRDQVVEEWAKRVFSVRTRLLALPRTLGSRCANMPADMVEREADAVIRELLAEYVAEGQYTPTPRGTS